MSHSPAYYDLLDSFAHPGCAFCRLGQAAVHRWIDAVNHESASDHGIVANLRASLGFCNVHAHQWLARASVLATATVALNVLSRVEEIVEGRSYQDASFLGRVGGLLARGPVDDVLTPTRLCPMCEMMGHTESMLSAALLPGLTEPSFRDAYGQSGGLCVPHLRGVLPKAGDAAVFDVLRDTALAREQVLLAELRETIRKHDYRFNGEPAGAERGSGERAMQHLAGAPGMTFGPAARAARRS